MPDDCVQAVLSLLTASLGVSTALIEDLPPTVQRALTEALDQSSMGYSQVEDGGNLYFGYRAAALSVPVLVAVLDPSLHGDRDGSGGIGTETRNIGTALQAASTVIERSLAKRQWVETPSQLQTIIDQLPEAVLLASPNPDRVVLANRRVTDLLGWRVCPPLRLDDFIGHNRRSTVDGTPLTTAELPLARALRQGETITQREIQLERPDGTQARLLVNAAPLTDARSQITSAVAVFQDVSQITAAEQLRDDFLTLASHELRTPLTAIQGGTYLLLHDGEKLSGQTRNELLADVVGASQRLGDLVENMAQVTTIRAGHVIVQREPITLRTLIEDLISDVVLPGLPRSLTVEVPLDLIVLGDPQRLDQVLRNLLYNALKYSPDGTPIEIAAAPQGEMVVISVRDHGPGFASAAPARIFDRFSDAEANSLTTRKGLGLGLYLAKQFVEAQGGQIWIAQPEGGGAEVRFTIPRADESPDS